MKHARCKSGVCGLVVADDDKAVLCNCCELWQHSTCVGLADHEYEDLQRESDDISWFCPACRPVLASNCSLTSEGVDSGSSGTPSISPATQVAKGGNLSIYYTNCRSLPSKLDELRIMALSLHPTFMAFTETWLDSTISDKGLHIDSYKLLRHDRNRHGGGVCIYVCESVTVSSVVRSQQLELIWVRVALSFGRRVLLGVFYRKPSSDIDLGQMEQELFPSRAPLTTLC